METKLLSKEELRSIRGGKVATSNNNAEVQGFPCRVVEKNGDEHIKITSTIEECLELGGYNYP